MLTSNYSYHICRVAIFEVDPDSDLTRKIWCEWRSKNTTKIWSHRIFSSIFKGVGSKPTQNRPEIFHFRFRTAKKVSFIQYCYTFFWFKAKNLSIISLPYIIFCSQRKGIESKRVYEAKVYKDFDSDYASRLTGKDGSIPMDLRFVELRLGNVCNVRCRTCNPASSSRQSSTVFSSILYYSLRLS